MHPILFHLGPIPVASYFVVMALVFGVVAVWVGRRAKVLGLTNQQIRVLIGVTLAAMVVGARLGYLVIHWQYYWVHPNEILRLDLGGYALFLALPIPALLAARLFVRYGLPVMKTFGRMVPPMVLGVAIMRIGCFLQGCCYGKITQVSWGIAIPPEPYLRHPTQLYELTALLLLLAGLLCQERKGVRPEIVLFTSCFVYGIWRFWVGFFRGDYPVALGGLTAAQGLALLLAAVGAIWLVRLSSPSKSGTSE